VGIQFGLGLLAEAFVSTRKPPSQMAVPSGYTIWLHRWGLRQVPHLPFDFNITSHFLENTELVNSRNESSANVSKVT